MMGYVGGIKQQKHFNPLIDGIAFQVGAWEAVKFLQPERLHLPLLQRLNHSAKALITSENTQRNLHTFVAETVNALCYVLGLAEYDPSTGF
jgi:hypothetical protein